MVTEYKSRSISEFQKQLPEGNMISGIGEGRGMSNWDFLE